MQSCMCVNAHAYNTYAVMYVCVNINVIHTQSCVCGRKFDIYMQSCVCEHKYA